MSLLDALAPTWPAKAQWDHGAFTIQDGAGGGKRVSAAALRDPQHVPNAEALGAAEAEMRRVGQNPLFSLTPDQSMFDAMLAARGYAQVDPTRLYHIPVTDLTTQKVPRVTVFEIWEPLAIMQDIWAAGGIGPARCAIMDRVTGPKTGLFGRIDSKPAGSGFVATAGDVAMVHALEVLSAHRRKGLARWMIIAAAHWAAAQGCATLALLVTEANHPANALYQSMGFSAQPGYHYRLLEE